MKALLRWFSSFTFTFFTTAVVCVAQTSANCTYQTFQYPGASHTTANGINQWGTIVGQVDDLAVSNEFGFIRYSHGQSQQITMPGAVSTRLFRRNAGGASVGTYIDSSGQGHGLLLSGGKFSTIDYPGASTELRGINKWGTIVGFYINSSGHAVGFKRWTNGSFSIIQFPGQSDTFPSAISDSGVIVGWVGAGAPPGGARGFVLANGKYLYVDDPNSTARQTVLYDINANGVIVGTGWNSAVGGAAARFPDRERQVRISLCSPERCGNTLMALMALA